MDKSKISTAQTESITSCQVVPFAQPQCMYVYVKMDANSIVAFKIEAFQGLKLRKVEQELEMVDMH